MKHSYKLGEVWESMKSSDDLLLQLAGYHSEMVNTIGIVSFLWLATFMVIIPSIASIIFPKRKNLVFVFVFILSFSAMGSIQSWAWEKVNIHWDMMNKPYVINVDDNRWENNSNIKKGDFKGTHKIKEEPYVIKIDDTQTLDFPLNIGKSYLYVNFFKLLNSKDKKFFDEGAMNLQLEEVSKYTSSASLVIFEIKYLEPLLVSKTLVSREYIKKSKYILVKILPSVFTNFDPLKLNSKDFIFSEILNYSDMKYLNRRSFTDRDVCIKEWRKNSFHKNNWISFIENTSNTHGEWIRADKCVIGNLDYELKEI